MLTVLTDNKNTIETDIKALTLGRGEVGFYHNQDIDTNKPILLICKMKDAMPPGEPLGQNSILKIDTDKEHIALEFETIEAFDLLINQLQRMKQKSLELQQAGQVKE